MTNPGAALLAYDGSPSAGAAIAVAGRLLRGRAAVVCHVWSGVSQAVFHTTPSGLPGVLSDAATEIDEYDREVAEKVAAEGTELAQAAGFDAEALTERVEANAWRTILAVADRVQASIVVAGAQGRSAIGRVVLGSVSGGLVHHAGVPVLVVPGRGSEESPSGPPLFSYDGSDTSKRAIELGAELLAARSGLVGHFWSSWAAEAPALAGANATVLGMATKLDEIARDQGDALTADGVAVAEAAGWEATGASERATGPIWRAVLDTADEHDCACIVLGSRGLTGISAALGSVSNGVVHHTRRPVLVVPPANRQDA